MIKTKIISYIIIAEISLIISLLLFLFINLDSNTLHQNKIKVSFDRKIYSKDNSEPFTGKMQDTLDNKLIVQFSVVNGIKQGEFTLLTLEGSLAVQGYMNKNKNDGDWKYYYSNGQVECEGEFDNDELSGRWLWYYHDGAIKCEGIYIKGKPEGKWTKYDDDGSPSMILNYSNGELISFIRLDKSARI